MNMDNCFGSFAVVLRGTMGSFLGRGSWGEECGIYQDGRYSSIIICEKIDCS